MPPSHPPAAPPALESRRAVASPITIRGNAMRPLSAILFLSIGLPLFSAPAWAELAVAANDGKQLLAGEPPTVTPDSVSIIDLGHYPPKVLGSVAVPASMIGSPNAVAVGADEKFAIVTASQKFN